MPMFVDLQRFEMRRRLEPSEYLTLRDQWPQIYNTLKAVVETNLEHTVDDRFGEDYVRQRLHSTGSTLSWAIAAANRC